MNSFFLEKITGKLLFLAIASLISVAHAQNNAAKAMRTTYERLKPELEQNTYHNPIWLSSLENQNSITGEIYGKLDHPFSAVRQNLRDPVSWCEILFLHLNIKYCKVTDGQTIEIYAGTKKPQSLETATRMQYHFSKIADNGNYMNVAMNAEKGPYGTSHVSITMQAIPINTRQSFIRVDYGYRYGTAAKLAMKTYLATTGKNKAGISVTGKKADGTPEYASGMRGIIERNALRYYLAVNAYLDSLSLPVNKQRDYRLTAWFDATARYPQLHEISKDAYLKMKKEEYRRSKENIQTIYLPQ
ncbi:MAG: hypothetical protein NC211_03985 [Alistipes senegalensis]|nr:hypothetical protein [Oxalobacter formigenes]MCM1280977.1 hypothetical protein [Alistipes senegalensis]